jgi:DNA-directed RNA polymerase specialized sigma24 family protein
VDTEAAQRYLQHTEQGLSIREVARISGCHASTVLRQIRRYENRRDDPLIDEALSTFGALGTHSNTTEDDTPMTAPIRQKHLKTDEAKLNREGRRVLRRLCESGAVLVVAADLDRAVVMRELPGGQTARTAVVDREIAQAMALKDWISCTKKTKISQYEVTSAGRLALKRLLAEQELVKGKSGFEEAPSVFGEQHRVWGEKQVVDEPGQKPRTTRYNLAESPLATLARRRDKDGTPFLSNDLVTAGERLREDFEIAQMGPRVAQNWEKFLTGGARGTGAGDASDRSGNARDRVSLALRDLGPGLGDVVLRCCCFLEGMEAAEKRMGWSARSGKIVLRIALQRLKRHYDEAYGPHGPMIG